MLAAFDYYCYMVVQSARLGQRHWHIGRGDFAKLTGLTFLFSFILSLICLPIFFLNASLHFALDTFNQICFTCISLLFFLHRVRDLPAF